MPASQVLPKLKPLIGVEIVDVSRDAELTGYVESAISAISTFLGYTIDSTEYQEYHDNVNGIVILKKRPVVSVTTLQIDGVDADMSNYRVKTQAGIISPKGGKPGISADEVYVVYSAGYTTYPVWLEDAIANTAAYFAELAETGSGNNVDQTGPVKKETVYGISSIEYDTSSIQGSVADKSTNSYGIPDNVLTMLESHRTVGIG